MIPIAHHAGEEVVLAAAIGSGLFSATLLFVRTRVTEVARRRWPRR